MTSHEKLNFAIIGAGVIGTRLASSFSKVPEIAIAYICDIDLDKANVLASKYSAKAVSNYEEILKDYSISVVYVGVPPSLHKKFTIEFLRAGKHVICEKPLALSVKDCNEMITAGNNSGLLTTVNLPFRYTVGVTKMKELLQEQYVGEVKKIELKFRFPIWPRAWQNVSWLSKKFQGGPLREVGTHFFFLLHELYGDVDKILSLVQYPNEEDSETFASGIIKMKNGLVATIDLLAGIPSKEENSFTIIGSKGTLSLSEWYKLLGSQSGEEPEVLIDYSERSDLQMTKEFVKKLLDENSQTTLVSFDDAMYPQKILEAILKSNESWITIE